MIGFNWRWLPHYQYLRRLVADGFVGRSYHATYRFFSDRGRSKDYTWRFDPRRSCGVLGDIGSHMIDLAVWISGDITSVSAHLASYGQRTDPEGRPFTEANQSAHLVVEFADGSHGSIHVSQMVVHTASRRREQNVSLHGEGGALEVDWYVGDLNFTEGLTLQGCRHDEQEYRVLAIPETFLMGAEAGVVLPVMQKHVVGPRLFVDAIARDYQPTPNFVQGVKVQKVIDAAMRSHQTGQRVLVKI